jgi:hypothetical protein
MKPLQNFWEYTMLICVHLKFIKLKEMLFVYGFVSSRCEMNVSLMTATPLINGVLDLEH